MSIKPDAEGKSRVFAIVDYYSQSVLKPLHDTLFILLKRIPSDRTFVQSDGILSSFKALPGHSYHSIDLSNATDRFPVEIQRRLLAELFNQQYADEWVKVLTQYGFDYQGKSVLYRTGQPMGAYSS